jgi:hypothetical protein
VQAHYQRLSLRKLLSSASPREAESIGKSGIGSTDSAVSAAADSAGDHASAFFSTTESMHGALDELSSLDLLSRMR